MLRAREVAEEEERRGREGQGRLRESERRLQDLEGRNKDAELMGRIREAEHSQQVGESGRAGQLDFGFTG